MPKNNFKNIFIHFKILEKIKLNKQYFIHFITNQNTNFRSRKWNWSKRAWQTFKFHFREIFSMFSPTKFSVMSLLRRFCFQGLSVAVVHTAGDVLMQKCVEKSEVINVKRSFYKVAEGFVGGIVMGGWYRILGGSLSSPFLRTIGKHFKSTRALRVSIRWHQSNIKFIPVDQFIFVPVFTKYSSLAMPSLESGWGPVSQYVNFSFMPTKYQAIFNSISAVSSSFIDANYPPTRKLVKTIQLTVNGKEFSWHFSVPIYVSSVDGKDVNMKTERLADFKIPNTDVQLADDDDDNQCPHTKHQCPIFNTSLKIIWWIDNLRGEWRCLPNKSDRWPDNGSVLLASLVTISEKHESAMLERSGSGN